MTRQSSTEDRTTFELRIDGAAFTLSVGDGDVSARHGETEAPTATLTGSVRDFFATTKGRTATARRIAVDGNTAAAKQLIDAMTGCLV